MFILLSVSLLLVVSQVKTDTCTLPNGQIGDCIGSDVCVGLTQIFANYANGTEELLKKFFHCSKYGYVCCPHHWKSTLYNEKLSDIAYCGLQHKDDYPSTTSVISIDEFPWLAALIGHDDSRNPRVEVDIRCQGTLINNRYVLTAAQCCTDRSWKIIKIRLGEYNLNNSTDCVAVPGDGLEDCSTVEEFAVEEVIPHYFFSRNTRNHDICLIRLNKTVSYTDYIRPICLPIPGTTFAKPGDLLYATGWGETTAGSVSELKKKISTKLTTNEECAKYFELRGVPDQTPYKVCTEDELNTNGDNLCDGDAGGPIVFSSLRKQWHIEGIVSSGKGCGKGLIQIHTRVSSYLNWIRQHLRP